MNEKVIIKEDYSDKLIIKGKEIEELQLIYCEFKEWLSIIDCKIKSASFQAAYFSKGILIKDTEFINNVDFSMGNTVNSESDFTIENVVFNGFVDFQDYFFRGKTTFRNVAFLSGTNLFGNKNTPVEVGFDSAPILINTSGIIDINDF